MDKDLHIESALEKAFHAGSLHEGFTATAQLVSLVQPSLFAQGLDVCTADVRSALTSMVGKKKVLKIVDGRNYLWGLYTPANKEKQDRWVADHSEEEEARVDVLADLVEKRMQRKGYDAHLTVSAFRGKASIEVPLSQAAGFLEKVHRMLGEVG